MSFVTCAKLDQALATKQDALEDCNGAPLTGPVPTCAQTEAAILEATAGKQDALRNCAGDPHAAGTKVPSCAEMNAAIVAAATPDATDTVKGKASLAVAANYPSTSDTEATTPAYVAAALASIPAQVVTNVVETPGSKTYSYVNEANVTKVMTAAQQISATPGNAIGVGFDGGFVVSIPAQLPDDQVFSGDNSGNVALTMTPVTNPVTGNTDYIVKADLKVAATNPDGSANALQNTGNGFFVNPTTMAQTIAGSTASANAIAGIFKDCDNAPLTKDTKLATCAALTTGLAAKQPTITGGNIGDVYTKLPDGTYGFTTPSSGGGSVSDATDTNKGIVALAVASNYPSTSDVEAVTPAYLNAALADITVDDATDTVPGVVTLAVAANFPSTSDLETTTPAYVALAMAQVKRGWYFRAQI